MSATLSNFLQLSAIPCAAHPARDAGGKCMTNVDGVCISGGTKIAGTSGFGLASMGDPASTCASAGLFVSNYQRYTVNGFAVTKNANMLKLARPWL